MSDHPQIGRISEKTQKRCVGNKIIPGKGARESVNIYICNGECVIGPKMKIKMWKKLRSFYTNRRVGDFLCNFTAVILGIMLTFMGNTWIEERNTQRDVKTTLQLVKSELEANRNTILQGKQRIESEIGAAQFLLKNRDRLSSVSKDSLNYYSNLPFQTSLLTFTTDALELMKNSALFTQIKDKKLGLSIIQAYASVKTAGILYTSYVDSKKEKNDRMDRNPEIARIFAQKLPNDLLWSYLLNTTEASQ